METQKIYSVLLDENNYFTGMSCLNKYSSFDGGVDVAALPLSDFTEDDIKNGTSTIKLKSYKLVEGMWEFDEARYNELLAEEEEKKVAPVQPTQEERITALEEQNEMLIGCLLEMSELLYV